MKKLCGLTLVLLLSAFLCHTEGQATHAGIDVRASSLKPLKLHITLTPAAIRQVEIDRGQLPWSTRYGMVLVAVQGDSQCLEKVLPVEDAPVGRVSVEPGKALSGDLDLEGIFKGLDQARKKSDIQLFWAYQAPGELNIGHWLGGWILIPQDRVP